MNEQTPPVEPTTPAHASRRSFLLGAGAGAGAMSAVALGAGAAAAAARSDSAEPPDDGTAPDGAVVAYVRDVNSGEISLMADGNEVVITDRALARTLARKAR